MDPSTIKFRKAAREDISAIVEMIADDALGKRRENFQNPLPKAYYEAFENIDSNDNQELIVVEKAGQIIGTMQLSFMQYLTYQGGIRAQIEAVRVHRSQRGKGIGKIFLQWAIDHAKKKGVHLIQLTTDKKRPEALRFYEKLGFKASHEGMKLHF